MERAALQIRGTAVDADTIRETLDLTRQWYERSRSQVSADLPRLAQNDPFLWNPQNKALHYLRVIFGSPLVEQILIHFLNDRWFRTIPALPC